MLLASPPPAALLFTATAPMPLAPPPSAELQ